MKKKWLIAYLIVLLAFSVIHIADVYPKIESTSRKYFEYPTETWIIEKQDYFGTFLDWTFVPVDGQQGDKRVWNFTWQHKAYIETFNETTEEVKRVENPIFEIREATGNDTKLSEIYTATSPLQFKSWGDFKSDVSRLDKYPIVPEDKEEFVGLYTNIDVLNDDWGTFQVSFKDKWKPGKKITIGFGSTITYSGATDTITVTGGAEGSEITFWDVWNASDVNGWGVVHNNNESNVQYQIDCKLQIGDGGTQTWFATEGEVVVFTKNVAQTLLLKGGYYAPIRTHFRMGNLDSNEEAFNGSISIFETTIAGVEYFYALNSDIKFYDSIIVYTSHGICNWYASGSTLGSADIQRSKIDFSSTVSLNFFELKVADCQIDGLEVYGGSFLPEITPLYVWNDIYLMGQEYGTGVALFPQFGNPIIIKNLKVSDKKTHEFHIYGNANCTLIDVVVVWDDITFEAPINSEQWWIRYCFRVNVTDSAGSPIENANITVRHYGTEPAQDFTVLTWANGTHPEQNLLFMKLNATGGATPYYMNPYNLTITKSGYQTYTANFTVTEKLEWQISLQSKTANASWTLSLFGLVLIAVCVPALLVIIMVKKL